MRPWFIQVKYYAFPGQYKVLVPSMLLLCILNMCIYIILITHKRGNFPFIWRILFHISLVWVLQSLNFSENVFILPSLLFSMGIIVLVGRLTFFQRLYALNSLYIALLFLLISQSSVLYLLPWRLHGPFCPAAFKISSFIWFWAILL